MKLALAALAALFLLQDPETPPATEQDETVRELIEMLDSTDLGEREVAMERLTAMGPDVLPRLREALKSGSQEIRARAQAVIDAIEKAEKVRTLCPPHVPLSLDFKDAPISEVLSAIEKQAGVTVENADIDGERTVSVSVAGGSVAEILDSVCRQIKDAEWTNPGAGKFLLKKGKFTDAPAAYSGHFRLRLTKLELSRSTDFKEHTGRVTFHVLSSAAKGVKTDFDPVIEIEKVIDGEGTELKDAAADAMNNMAGALIKQLGGMQGSSAEGQMFSYAGVGRKAETLKIIRGTVRYSFPLASTEVEMTDVTAGKSQTEGDFTLTITQMNRNYIFLTITSKNNGIDLAKVIDSTSLKVYDKDDKELRVQTQLGNFGVIAGRVQPAANSYSFYIMVQEAKQVKAARIKFKLIREFHIEEIPFEIRDVTLP